MIAELSRVMKKINSRCFLYDVFLAFFMFVSTLSIYTVWQAETQRFIYNKHEVLQYRVYENSDPSRFSAFKDDAWQMMTLFSALSLMFLIFRKNAHTFITN